MVNNRLSAVEPLLYTRDEFPLSMRSNPADGSVEQTGMS